MSLFNILYTHVNKVNIRHLYLGIFLTPDKRVATVMKGVKVANWQTCDKPG